MLRIFSSEQFQGINIFKFKHVFGITFSLSIQSNCYERSYLLHNPTPGENEIGKLLRVHTAAIRFTSNMVRAECTDGQAALSLNGQKKHPFFLYENNLLCRIFVASATQTVSNEWISFMLTCWKWHWKLSFNETDLFSQWNSRLFCKVTLNANLKLNFDNLSRNNFKLPACYHTKTPCCSLKMNIALN